MYLGCQSINLHWGEELRAADTVVVKRVMRLFTEISGDALVRQEAGWPVGFSRPSSPREPVPLARPYLPKATISPNQANSWGPDI